MRHIKLFISSFILFLFAIPCMAQQDLRPSAYVGQQKKVTVRGGKVLGSSGGVTNLASQDITATVNATTYIYVDLSGTPVIATSNSGFPTTNFFPICTVTADINGIITSFIDNRPDSFMAGGGGTGVSFTGVLANIPALCSVGQLAFITDATPGQNVYECAATNTWTQQLNSGAAGANTALSNLVAPSLNATLVPSSAGARNLGTAPLPFGDIFLGSAGANKALDFNTAALTANRTVTVPDAATALPQPVSGTTSNWINSMSATGVFSKSQPAFTDISGSATAGQLPVTLVYTGQQNTYGAFLQDFTSASFKVPNSAGAAPTTSALIAYDTTAQRFSFGINGVNSFMPYFQAAPVNGQCPQFSGTNGLVISIACGGVNPASQFSIPYYSGAGTSSALSGITAPTANGSYILSYNVSGGTAVAPTVILPGVPVNAQATSYTLQYSDRASFLPFTGTTSTLTLPAIGTGNMASNFPFLTRNAGSGNLTVTATSPNTIDGGAAGGSVTVIPNFVRFFYQDNTPAWQSVYYPTYAAFGANCGDATHAISWSTTAGFGCQAITATAAAGGSNTQIQWNNATALAGITQWTTNGTTTMTGGATGVLDLSAMAPASGLKLPTVAGAVPTADSFLGVNSTNHTTVFGSNGTTMIAAAAATGTNTATTCTNQVVTAVSGIAAPTCTALTTAFLPAGVVTTSGSPANGQLAKFSGATTVTTATQGDVSATAYAAGGGTAQAQTVTLAPAVGALANGLNVCWLPLAANTGAGPTLAVNGLAAKSITKLGTTALVANDLTTTGIACAIYDGTEFQLQNPQTTSGGGGGTSMQVNTVALSSTANLSSTTPVLPSGTPPDAHTLTVQKDSAATNNVSFYDSLAIIQNPVMGRRGWACIASGQTGNRLNCAVDGSNMIGHTGTDGSTNPTSTAPWLTTEATGTVANTPAGLDIGDGNLAFNFGSNANQVNLYFAWKGSVSATTNMRLWAGFSNNALTTQAGSATPGGSFAAFRMDSATDTTTIQAITCNAGTCTTTSTSTTLDTNIHKYEIVEQDGTPNYVFRIDGTTVATLTTNLPPTSARCTPMASITNTTTTSVTLSTAAMVGTTGQ